MQSRNSEPLVHNNSYLTLAAVSHPPADIMLKVNAQAYLVAAGNVRHEHEYKVWRDVKLPAGKIIIPGVVSHATDLVEHPELVANRIVAFAGRPRKRGSRVRLA